MTNPWTPRSSEPLAAWAAAARLRTAPPMPTIRLPDEASQSSPDNVSATWSRSLERSFFLTGPSPGRNCSVTRTAPSGKEADSCARRPATWVSCMLPPPMSSTTPSDSVVVLTAAT